MITCKVGFSKAWDKFWLDAIPDAINDIWVTVEIKPSFAR